MSYPSKKLAELCLVVNRGISPSYTEKGGVQVINQKCVRNGRVLLNEARYTDPEKKHIPDDRYVQNFDILVNSTGVGTLGRVGQVIAIDEITTIDSHVTLVRPNSQFIDPLFLGYAVKYKQPEIENLAEGTTGQTELSRERLRDILIPLPPLPEQRRISEILVCLDDKIELNRKMNKTLEAMAQAIFKSWFVDFDPVRAKMEGRQPAGMDASTAALFPDSMDGDVPRGWRMVSLADFCEKPQYGFTASAKDEPIGPKLLRITDINKEPWISWDSVPYCAIPENEFPKYSLRFGDLLIARMADPGHGVLIEEDINAVFASYLIRFRPKEKQFGRYLQYWQKSPIYWEQINALKTGTTRPSLNAPTLSNLNILKPNKDVLEAFSSIANLMRNKIIHNVNESRILSNLRDSLLPKLLSGEVVM